MAYNLPLNYMRASLNTVMQIHLQLFWDTVSVRLPLNSKCRELLSVMNMTGRQGVSVNLGHVSHQVSICVFKLIDTLSNIMDNLVMEITL